VNHFSSRHSRIRDNKVKQNLYNCETLIECIQPLPSSLLCDKVAEFFVFFVLLISLTSCSWEAKIANKDLKLALKLFCKNRPIMRAPVCCVIFPVHVLCGVHARGMVLIFFIHQSSYTLGKYISSQNCWQSTRIIIFARHFLAAIWWYIYMRGLSCNLHQNFILSEYFGTVNRGIMKYISWWTDLQTKHFTAVAYQRWFVLEPKRIIMSTRHVLYAL